MSGGLGVACERSGRRRLSGSDARIVLRDVGAWKVLSRLLGRAIGASVHRLGEKVVRLLA